MKAEKDTKGKISNLVLEALNNVALKNANSACRGFIYEPKVPKKLQKNAK